MCLQEPSRSFCGILNELTGEHFWALVSQLRGMECVRSTPLHLFSCHVRSCSPQGNTPVTVKNCMLHTIKNICLQVPSAKQIKFCLNQRKQENWSHQNILKTDISLVGHYILRDLHVDPMYTKWQVISLIFLFFSLGCFYQDANSRVHGMRGSFHRWGKHIKEQEIRSMVWNLLKENPW